MARVFLICAENILALKCNSQKMPSDVDVYLWHTCIQNNFISTQAAGQLLRKAKNESLDENLDQ